MDTKEIQKRIDTMPAAMAAKGLRKPRAEFDIRGNEELRGMLSWDDTKSSYGSKYEWIAGKTPESTLKKMNAFIAALPSPEETRMKEFMTALSDVIELGRKSGVEVEFVNPLVDTMRRLSSNIITDQRDVA